jgi:hypothetical protein
MSEENTNYKSQFHLEDLNNMNENKINKEKLPSTYICIGNEQDGQLEIDLVQFREKNVSMRYLSFTFSGLNPKTGQLQSAFINIDNEEAFETIKDFFSQLDWNS